MKSFKFLLIAGFVIVFASCNNEASVKQEESSDELSVVVTKAAAYGSYNSADDNTIAFKGSDIKSYNLTTGEMIFTGLTFEQLRSRTANASLSFYLGDKKLFESSSIGYDSLYIQSRAVINDLVFILRSDLNERLFLMDGFPSLDWVANFGASEAEAAGVRETNTQKRAAEWKLFIDYLKESGKLIEEPSDSSPGNVPSLPEDSIRIASIPDPDGTITVRRYSSANV
ncbi:MAG: hypothetical protein LBR67_00680 [Dysgonamonadaceae bacterium]|jgi:hypothetical protein|nr:hypothetical protein [Dysgonamonadaceae bacterium]